VHTKLSKVIVAMVAAMILIQPAYAGDYNEGNTGSSPKSDGGGVTGANSDSQKGAAQAGREAADRAMRDRFNKAIGDSMKAIGYTLGGGAFLGLSWRTVVGLAGAAGLATGAQSFLRSVWSAHDNRSEHGWRGSDFAGAHAYGKAGARAGGGVSTKNHEMQ
jgi:hypothetical protein